MRRLASPKRTIVGIAVAFLLIVALAGTLIHALTVRSEYDQAVARARSLGLPTDGIPPQSRKRIPDLENAALTPAFDLEKNNPPILKFKGSYTAKELKTYVDAGAAHAKLIQDTAALPSFRINRDSFNPNTTRPETTFIKNWAKYFCQRAIETAKKLDYPSAEKDLKTSAKLADYVGQEGDQIAALVQISINAITRKSFLQIVKQSKASPESLKLAQSVESDLSTPDFATVAKSETALALASADYLCSHPKVARAWAEMDAKFPPNTPADLAALKTKILNQYSKSFQTVQSNPFAFKQLHDDPGLPLPKGAFILGEDLYAWMLQPSLSISLMSILDDQTNHRLTRLGLEFLAFQNRNGTLPKSLDALPTNQPLVDPWSNKPFLYRTEKKWFVLYSVGSNQTDDGGHAVVPKPDAPKGLMPGFGTPPAEHLSQPTDDLLFQTSDTTLPYLTKGRK